MSDEDLLAFRREKDRFFKSHHQSPLKPHQRAVFGGLRYYDPNPDLDLVVSLTPFAEQDDILVETTTGDKRVYTRYGEIHFTVDGEAARLTVYETDFGFFLPFADVNANTETYGAGRYLEPEHLGGNRFHVDFNLAYNPFCAYNAAYSCPLTPFENRLKVPIRAGEKLPEGDWVEKP
ncbi:MAG: DUF1684 domain-containing protein [Anaerolineae bacterium]|nr:DUF1684 domain-containing protein [Anaerolineae bacterium]